MKEMREYEFSVPVFRNILKETIIFYRNKIKDREESIRKTKNDPELRNWKKLEKENNDDLRKLKYNLFDIENLLKTLK